jgi:putative addiction module component (TIGR02574 family)
MALGAVEGIRAKNETTGESVGIQSKNMSANVLGMQADHAGHFAASKEVQFCMDRSFEDLRHEVLELDLESQRKLADEIEENLAESQTEVDEAWRLEIKSRLDEYRRGEGTSLSREESMGQVRRMIEEAKRTRI